MRPLILPEREDSRIELSRTHEQGIALLIALVVLSVFSLLGLYMALDSATSLRISDNHESQICAGYAALAGLNHARTALRGLEFDAALNGPDGAHDGSPAYLTQARAFAFRNPLSWSVARSLDIFDPVGALGGMPDDGLVNTGYSGTSPGTVLIPLAGIAQTVPNPYGSGSVTISRYFAKVSDNNGEPEELGGDPADDPFHDGDGVVIVRSLGIARTLTDTAGLTARKNSIVVYEARLKHRSTFMLEAPLVIEANEVNAIFNGSAFSITGGGQPGIGVIDTDEGDSYHPAEELRSAAQGRGRITGGGLPEPSVADLTRTTTSNPDRARLRDPNYLSNFVHNVVPGFADHVYNGDQIWTGESAPNIGSFDHSQPANSPGQSPKVTLVDGNLALAGNVTGAGLLVVTGDLTCTGGFSFDGLVLVVGTGNVNADGMNPGIYGGIFTARLNGDRFGTPTISVSGNSNIVADSNALSMAVRLIPPAQISFREVTGVLDP